MTNSKTLWTLLLTLALVGCAMEGSATTGEPLGAEALPPQSDPSWVVAVSSFDEAGEHQFCTGTVIGPYAVLTHAACVGADVSRTEIVLGDDTRYGYRIPVAEVSISQDAPTIGVVLSDEPLPTETARLAPEPLTDIDRATVIGYGASGSGASILGVKHETPVRIGADEADSPFARVYADDTGLCFGDLGAPLVREGLVVGLVSELGATCVPEASTFARSLALAQDFVEAHADTVPGTGTER